MEYDVDSIDLAEVNPVKLAGLLQNSGWAVKGGRTDSYTRLAPPGNDIRFPGSLIIPLNANAPDYRELLRVALLELSQDRDLWVHTLFPRLAIEISDSFYFRKESSAPSGLIAWNLGEQLIHSARRALLAGAKYYISPKRHFSNTHGRFAGRYLDSVLMGQTAPGSYIVTVYTPANSFVSIKGGSASAPDFEYSNVARARDVSLAVVSAIEATLEAVDHYNRHGSMSGFDDGVAAGVSYEMTSALAGIAQNSDGADIRVTWNPELAIPASASATTTFDLRGSDAEVLDRAATSLAQDESAERVTIIGRVHLLSRKEAGAPGVFGMDALLPGTPKKARVRLASSDEYHLAVRAHEEELALRVTGNLEREGTLSWLYDAHILDVVGPIDDIFPPKGRRRSTGPAEGQEPIF